VIIVSISNRRPEGPRRLLGSSLTEEDPVRGAVLAVLSGTNRVVSITSFADVRDDKVTRVRRGSFSRWKTT